MSQYARANPQRFGKRRHYGPRPPRKSRGRADAVRARVFGLVLSAGAGGVTADDVAAAAVGIGDHRRLPAAGLGRREADAMLAGMAALGLVVDTGNRRGGSIVWAAKPLEVTK